MCACPFASTARLQTTDASLTRLRSRSADCSIELMLCESGANALSPPPPNLSQLTWHNSVHAVDAHQHSTAHVWQKEGRANVENMTLPLCTPPSPIHRRAHNLSLLVNLLVRHPHLLYFRAVCAVCFVNTLNTMEA